MKPDIDVTSGVIKLVEVPGISELKLLDWLWEDNCRVGVYMIIINNEIKIINIYKYLKSLMIYLLYN